MDLLDWSVKKETLHLTGHRPPALGGYDIHAEENRWILNKGRELLIFFKSVGFKRLIGGMALGWDQWMFVEAWKLGGLELIAAIPCIGQEKKWPQDSQMLYHKILKACSEVHYVSDKPYDRNCMQERNMWMVDRSIATLAAYKGIAGGTDNCLMYAKRRGNLIYTVDSNKRTVDLMLGDSIFHFPG